MRKLVDVTFSGRALVTLLIKTDSNIAHSVTYEGLPIDAKYLSCYHDYLTDTFHFIFQHESFEEVAEGDRPPQIAGIFKASAKQGIIDFLTSKISDLEVACAQQTYLKEQWGAQVTALNNEVTELKKP